VQQVGFIYKINVEEYKQFQQFYSTSKLRLSAINMEDTAKLIRSIIFYHPC